MTLDEAITNASNAASKMLLTCKEKDRHLAIEKAELAEWLIELRARRNLDKLGHNIDESYDKDIAKFLKMNHSNGNITALYACRYIEDLWNENKRLKEKREE